MILGCHIQLGSMTFQVHETLMFVYISPLDEQFHDMNMLGCNFLKQCVIDNEPILLGMYVCNIVSLHETIRLAMIPLELTADVTNFYTMHRHISDSSQRSRVKIACRSVAFAVLRAHCVSRRTLYIWQMTSQFWWKQDMRPTYESVKNRASDMSSILRFVSSRRLALLHN